MERPIQILFKTKGVIVEKWIIGGGSNLIHRTKEFASIDKLNCEAHDDLRNVELSDLGITCKTCGVKLKLVPEWVVSS